MDKVGVTEYVKGDNRKFEIWYAGKEEVYIVQVGHLKIILESITCIKIQKSEFSNKIILVILPKFSFLSHRSLNYYFAIVFL